MTITHQQHFHKFLTQCLELPGITLNSYPLPACNQVFIMYCTTLTIGKTINGKPIKAATIKNYLHAAALYVRLIRQQLECPLIDPSTKKQHGQITKLLNDFKKWEDEPKRRLALTKQMTQNL